MPHPARNAAIAILVGLAAGALAGFVGEVAFAIGFGVALAMVTWVFLSRSRGS